MNKDILALRHGPLLRAKFLELDQVIKANNASLDE